MKIVIVGQKWLGVQVLNACTAAGHEVVAVVAPSGDRLALAAHCLGLPLVAGSLVTGAQVPPCDLMLAAHAHAYITASARAKAAIGCAGFHPSLLPRHRGRDAIRWAIHMRETVTGGTLYWMDDGVDTGPIIYQDWCHIAPSDTPAELWTRDLAPMGVRMFSRLIEQCAAGSPPAGSEQCDDLATWEPAFNREQLKRSN
ncbi:MAG: methionyl-tRNA formyltransferase [Pseudomonadales bacterium]|nr:methionyl-tRNA formyltransferase [Pseudomonadales bacterium]